MTRTIALSLLLAAAAVAQDPPKPKAESTLTLTAALDRADGKYVLGEDLQIEVKLENAGDKDVEVNELTYEESSLSYAVKADWTGGGTREYVLSVARPDAHVKSRLTPGRITLGAKKSVSYLRRFPTVAPGDFTITARYQSGAGEVVATGVKAKVEASSSGNKLVATVATHSHGSFSFELKPQEAPASVTSFVELVKKDFYRDMIFFRVINKNWIQTGCPYATGLGGPGYAMKAEADGQTSVHEPGTVSLAGNEKGGWTGSQFFVTLSRLPGLDKKFTVIGKLVDGQLDVVNGIGKAEVDKNTDRPRNDIRIQNVTIAVKN